ncbi:hypothetical protein MRX96_011810 [Rhipicephalus microplus]
MHKAPAAPHPPRMQVQELHQRYAPCLGLVVRLFENEDTIEFEWLLGLVPLAVTTRARRSCAGSPAACRAANSSTPNPTGYAASERKYDSGIPYKFLFILQVKLKRLERIPVASNFYPVTSWAFLVIWTWRPWRSSRACWKLKLDLVGPADFSGMPWPVP